MDNLFKTRTLTGAVNAMRKPGRYIAQTYFNSKLRGEDTDRLAFDIISGSEKVLANIGVADPATVGTKTGRKTITLTAPRLSEKRLIHTYEMNALRGFSSQGMTERLKSRIAREQFDMRNMIDRTIEFYCAYALRGKIYDSDLTTVLVDYNMDPDHTPTLEGTDLWSDTDDSDPLADIRSWKLLIEDDSGHEITGWSAVCGSSAMTALLNNNKVLELLKYTNGAGLLEGARVANIAGVNIYEYNGSFLDSTGTRKRFVEATDFILIGEGVDVFDFPYARVVDEEDPGGVGNDGKPTLVFSNSWVEKDPSGRWIKVESRPLPVVQRPDAIVQATVTSS